MYDPMVAKLIVWDVDREHATRRALRALDEYEVGGLTTLIPFHKAILATEQWAKGETCRDLMEDRDWLKATAPEAAAPAEAPRVPRSSRATTRSRSRAALRRQGDRRGRGRGARSRGGRGPPKRERKSGGARRASSESLPSPLQGTVLGVAVGERRRGLRGGPDLRDRGDEDGERDRRPSLRKVTALNVTEGAAFPAAMFLRSSGRPSRKEELDRAFGLCAGRSRPATTGSLAVALPPLRRARAAARRTPLRGAIQPAPGAGCERYP